MFSMHTSDKYRNVIFMCEIYYFQFHPLFGIDVANCSACMPFADVGEVRVTRFHRVLLHCTRRFLYKVIVPWHWIRKHLLFFHLLAKKILRFTPYRTLVPPGRVQCVRNRLKWERDGNGNKNKTDFGVFGDLPALASFSVPSSRAGIDAVDVVVTLFLSPLSITLTYFCFNISILAWSASRTHIQRSTILCRTIQCTSTFPPVSRIHSSFCESF